ncbi:hypothetical protein AnigIFM60653_001759 [Aspergillus niger]|nr:hypothetical protein AnigIFM60653_001759 [Aspergillus niger]GLA17541.1 hypothetical protein AnigIFM62618_004681 [Aspergillus niger]
MNILGPIEDNGLPQIPASPGSFLFVNYQAQTSQGSTVSKKKHAFIKTMYHRSKKEQRLQKLKASIGPLPTQRSNPSILPSTPGSTTFPIDAEARVEEYEACSFDRALRPAGIDPFASLCVPAKSSVDFYFDHCKIESTSSGRINASDLSDHASKPDRMFLNRPVLAFQCRLEAALLPIRRLAVDLSFWMLFTGGIAVMGHPSRAWFVDRLAEVAGQLSLATWDEARALLEQFLFFSRPTDTRAEILWKEVKRQRNVMQNL